MVTVSCTEVRKNKNIINKLIKLLKKKFNGIKELYAEFVVKV